MDNKHTEKSTRETLINITILLIILLMVSVGISIWQSYSSFEKGIDKGIQTAENNCIDILCKNYGCKSISDINSISKYCKSVVYGTDFYLRFPN